MSRFLILIAAVLLTSCSNADGYSNNKIVPTSPSQAVQISSSKAAVVFGTIAVKPAPLRPFGYHEPSDISWIAIDPKTRQRTGTAMLSMIMPCSAFYSCDAVAGVAVQYQLFLLDPGTYALGCVMSGVYTATPSAFQQLAIYAEGIKGCAGTLEAQAKGIAPTFTLRAGEVVYAGDLAFDFSDRGWMRWSLQQHDAAAESFIRATGLADRMQFKAMRRADGAPIGPQDSDPVVASRPGTLTKVTFDPLPGQK